MSRESHCTDRTGPLVKLANTIFGWRKQRSKFAHPWSAYAAPTYLAGKAPKGIIVATKASTLLQVSSAKPCEDVRLVSPALTMVAKDEQPARVSDLAAFASKSIVIENAIPNIELPKVATAKAKPPVTAEPLKLLAPPQILKPLQLIETSTAEEAKLAPLAQKADRPAKPVELKVVATTTEVAAETPAPILPALAASTGRDFQFAARIKGVNALNRAIRPPVNVKSSQAFATKRTPEQAARTPRRLDVKPPVVLRKHRKSAQIIRLELTLARAVRQQSRQHRVA